MTTRAVGAASEVRNSPASIPSFLPPILKSLSRAAMLVSLLDRFFWLTRRSPSCIALLWGTCIVTFPWQGLPSEFNPDDSFSRSAHLHSCPDELSAFVQSLQGCGDDFSATRDRAKLTPVPTHGLWVDVDSWRAFSHRHHRFLLASQLFSSDL